MLHCAIYKYLPHWVFLYNISRWTDHHLRRCLSPIRASMTLAISLRTCPHFAINERLNHLPVLCATLHSMSPHLTLSKPRNLTWSLATTDPHIFPHSATYRALILALYCSQRGLHTLIHYWIARTLFHSSDLFTILPRTPSHFSKVILQAPLVYPLDLNTQNKVIILTFSHWKSHVV